MEFRSSEPSWPARRASVAVRTELAQAASQASMANSSPPNQSPATERRNLGPRYVGNERSPNEDFRGSRRSGRGPIADPNAARRSPSPQKMAHAPDPRWEGCLSHRSLHKEGYTGFIGREGGAGPHLHQYRDRAPVCSREQLRSSDTLNSMWNPSRSQIEAAKAAAKARAAARGRAVQQLPPQTTYPWPIPTASAPKYNTRHGIEGYSGHQPSRPVTDHLSSGPWHWCHSNPRSDARARSASPRRRRSEYLQRKKSVEDARLNLDID